MKRAFTLIELLVVIAIIAILAAILFPVFAQAKLAAKKTASLSNAKQNQLGAIMYGADADDFMPPMASWGDDSGAMIWISFGGPFEAYKSWAQLIYPYTKNYQLLIDPQAPANCPADPGWNPAVAYFLPPQYGLNPYLTYNVSLPYGSQGPLNVPRSYTAVTRPAEIVMLSQKYSSAETQPNSWWSGLGFWDGSSGWIIDCNTDGPDCQINTYTCWGGWGDNQAYGNDSGTGWLSSKAAAGAWTGGASLRMANKQIVTFTDGHVATKSSGDLAAGTNYQGALNGSGIPIQQASQIAWTDYTVEHYYGLH